MSNRTSQEQYGIASRHGRFGSTASLEIIHEIGADPDDITVEQSVPIDSSAPPEKIVIRSHVVATAARAQRSPAYLATIRRRESQKIAAKILDLEEHAAKSDFVIWSQEPLDDLRRLIQKLSDAEEFAKPEHEGNSCEILRQIRDTFLNSGWKKYRESAVRAGVIQILRTLAEEDEITAVHADQSHDTLLDMGLSPCVGLSFADVETEEV